MVDTENKQNTRYVRTWIANIFRSPKRENLYKHLRHCQRFIKAKFHYIFRWCVFGERTIAVIESYPTTSEDGGGGGKLLVNVLKCKTDRILFCKLSYSIIITPGIGIPFILEHTDGFLYKVILILSYRYHKICTQNKKQKYKRLSEL